MRPPSELPAAAAASGPGQGRQAGRQANQDKAERHFGNPIPGRQ